jgi:hypothetical protein
VFSEAANSADTATQAIAKNFIAFLPKSGMAAATFLFLREPRPACAYIVRDFARGPSAVDQIMVFLSTLWTAGKRT